MKKKVLSIDRFFIKPHKKALTAALVVLIVTLIFAGQTSQHYGAMFLDEKRQSIKGELDLYGNSLTITLNSYFSLLEGIHGFVRAENDAPVIHIESTFNDLAAVFYESASGIRNFSIAPNGVQTYVYPREGNENVFGHDLLNDERPEVRADVTRAIETREITLSGPYELRQSGLGLVAREAMYVDEEFWGLVAMVVDVPLILANAGLSNDNEHLIFALEDQKGEVFFGDSKILDEDPVRYKVLLPDGYWTLWAVPRDGWNSSSPRSLLVRFGVVFISLSLALITYLLFDRTERLQRNVNEKTQFLNQIMLNLEASEKKYRDLVNLAQEGIWVIDKDSKTTFVNPSMEKMLGYDAGEMLGKELFSFMDERGVEIATQKVEHRKEGVAEQHDFEFIRKDGKRIVVAMVTASISDEKGDYAGAIAGVIDITERKHVEKEIIEQRNKLDSIFRAAPAGIGMVIDRKIQFINEHFVEMLGYAKEELVGKLSRILYPTDAEFERVGKYKYEQIDKEGTGALETIFQKKDGSLINVLLSSSPIDLQNLSTGVTFVAFDITERKQTEEALQESEQRIRRYFDQKFLGMAITSVDQHWIEVNDALCAMFGYSREELLKLTWTETTHPEDLDANLALYKQALAGEIDSYSLEKRFLHKDGSIFYAELSVSVVRKDDGSTDYLITLINDITEHKEAEAALKRLNNELDERVEKRTKELNTMVMLMSGREIRMADLKKVITALRTQLKEAGIEPMAFDPLLGPDEEW